MEDHQVVGEAGVDFEVVEEALEERLLDHQSTSRRWEASCMP